MLQSNAARGRADAGGFLQHTAEIVKEAENQRLAKITLRCLPRGLRSTTMRHTYTAGRRTVMRRVVAGRREVTTNLTLSIGSHIELLLMRTAESCQVGDPFSGPPTVAKNVMWRALGMLFTLVLVTTPDHFFWAQCHACRTCGFRVPRAADHRARGLRALPRVRNTHMWACCANHPDTRVPEV